jgi:hypothetical protein
LKWRFKTSKRVAVANNLVYVTSGGFIYALEDL